MSETYKHFLMDDGRQFTPGTGRFVALAAFGKHPGWDDHVEDLGLETDSLNQARLMLYIQGVGGQIDTGAWEKLKDEQRLAAFNHTFVWQRGDQFLMGRMWSSSDGKGRTRYPMILCAHCIGLPLGWALENVLPRLVEIEDACKATKSAEDVRSILERARTSLRNRSANLPVDAPSSSDFAALNRFVTAPAFGPANEGWFRILYWLQSQAGMFGAGKYNSKTDTSGLRAQQIRVPSGIPEPNQAVLAWTRFFASHIDPQVPALFVWPVGEDWVDVTFGEPSTQEFFCLRASRAAIPLATEIPYDMSQDFRALAAQQLADFQAGRPQRAAVPPLEGQGSDTGGTSFTRRWLKGLFGLLILALIAVAGVVYWTNQSVPPGKEAASQPAARESPVASQAPPAAPVEKPPPKPAQENVPKQTTTEEEPAPSKVQPAAAPQARQVATAAPEPARTAVEPQPSQQASPVVAENQATTPDTGHAMENDVSVPPPQSTTLAASNEISPAPARASSASISSAGKAFTNGIGMALVWIPALPGSGAGGWVGRFEVTQADYRKLTGTNPSKFIDPDQPVENVSWRDATNFCRKLSAQEHAAGRLLPAFAYSLPTEQQWDFFLEDATFDNAVTSRKLQTPRAIPSRVGTLPPNRDGLYDVLGNVWEWCADGETPDVKALKGGAYNNGKIFQFKPLERTTARRLAVDARLAEAGFRCVIIEQP